MFIPSGAGDGFKFRVGQSKTFYHGLTFRCNLSLCTSVQVAAMGSAYSLLVSGTKTSIRNI